MCADGLLTIQQVLPKIVASQDSDAPEVQDVVRKLADRNPQKLRQIGMNYDIANAKGVIEISEEEKKKKEAKAKEAKEKKIKEKEDAEKDKIEFELWKKQKKELEEKEKATETKKQDSTESTAEAVKEAVKEAGKDEPTAVEKKVEAPESKEGSASSSADIKSIKPKPESDSSHDDEQDTPSTVDHPSPKASAPQMKGDSDDFPTVGAGPGGPPSVYGGDAAPQPAANAPASADNKQNPWNAVCVLGLRVYSQDPEVSIKLVKPKNASEGAVLDADGATQAGATM
jgi:hypothetical protein